MTAPVPELFDLLNGRPLHPGSGAVVSAIEHRLGGQLLSAVEAGSVSVIEEDRLTLTATDLAVVAHHRRLWRALNNVQRLLTDAGIQSISLKGVAEEARWYDRMGERPCSDVDLIVAPEDAEQVVEIFGSALPARPGHVVLVDLVRSRQLQHLHFFWEEVAIDLHFDPLKLGLWVDDRTLIADTATTVYGPAGEQITVLAPELALVSFLTHLNKDRFSYLGAYGDVGRILNRVDLDWDMIDRFVAAESLQVPVWKSLQAVLDVFDTTGDVPRRTVSRWQSMLWDRLWPQSSRLLGHQGMVERRHRQLMIPALTGRWQEVAGELKRAAFPPKGLLDYHRPELGNHSRFRRLSLDRIPRPGR